MIPNSSYGFILMPKFKFEFCSRYCLFLGSAQAWRDTNVSIEIEQCCYDKTQEGHVKWGYKGKGSSVDWGVDWRHVPRPPLMALFRLWGRGGQTNALKITICVIACKTTCLWTIPTKSTVIECLFNFFSDLFTGFYHFTVKHNLAYNSSTKI